MTERASSDRPECDLALVDGSRTLTVLVHGLEGSAADWRQVGGFTHGGDLTAALTARGDSWLACDLYGHGSWSADEPDFDPADIDDDAWDLFVARSCAAIGEAIDAAVRLQPVDDLRVVTYSAGAVIAARLLRDRPDLRPSSVVLASPTPEREEDDDYSLHHNVEPLTRGRLTLIHGTRDEEVDAGDVRWLAAQLPASTVVHAHDAGHALPAAWVDQAVDALAGR